MQKILIIRFSSIGDIVLTSPVIRCVKKQLNCKVHFLTKSKYEDLIQYNPYIEKYFLFDNNVRGLVRQLKKEQYTTIIDLQKNLLSYRVRFGLSVFTVDYQKEVFARWIFVNFKINLFKYKHVVFRYFSKLDNLNVTLSKSDLSREDSALDFFFPKNHIFKLSYLPPPFSKGFLCFCIGGQHFTKKIPVQKIISICKKIHYPIILIGGQEEKNNGDIIKSEVDKLIFNACGKSLLDSATIIQTSKGLLSPDTGMMHIATALNKKTITIWGGTTLELGFSSFSNFGAHNIDELVKENSEDINLNRNIDVIQRILCQPCSRFGRSKCPLGHHQCMENINENEVASYLKYWKDVRSK